MGSAAPNDKEQTMADLNAYRRARTTALNGGDYDAKAIGYAKPQNWDALSAEDKRLYLDTGRTGDAGRQYDEMAQKAGAANWHETAWKSILGDEYVDPATGRSKSMGKLAPDVTDDLLQKTRTNAYLRLQAGKNQKSSFAGTQLGGLSLGNSMLGGY